MAPVRIYLPSRSWGGRGTTILAVDVGNTKLALGLVDEGGRIALQKRAPTPVREGPQKAVERLIQMAREVLAAGPEPVRGVGIAFGGMVDRERQLALVSPNFPGWESVPLPRLFREATGLPAAMDNDANAGALAEAWVGGGVGVSDFVYMTVSTGVGGALVLGGHLYRGTDGLAGEIGHLTLLPDGPPCGCGKKGCLEALVSGPAIARAAERRLAGSLWDAYQNDRQILICGNGGSAATASHMACDLQKGTRPAAGKRFRAVGLVDNVPVLSAWSNDEAYETALARQVESLVCRDDLAFGISASGRSPNVLQALAAARARGARTAGLTGRRGDPLRALCDVACTVPTEDVEKLEDAHAVIMHVLISGLRVRIAAEGTQ